MSYRERLKKLQGTLKQCPCDALIIDEVTNIFYLTGLHLSLGRLFVTQNEAVLFVDGRYFELCREKSPFPVKSIDKKKFESYLTDPEFKSIKTVGFDTSTTTYKAFEILQKIPKIHLVPLDAPLQSIRAIKDKEEIKALKAAADLGSEGFDYVLTLLKEGITEIEIATKLEIFWKMKGSKSIAFEPIIAFGANSARPHHRAGSTALKASDVVLIDIGVNYKHYHSDMTRMAYFGFPKEEVVEILAIVAEAQQRALNLCRPGTTLADLDDAARDYIKEMGYGENFTHSLGHGVGLDIHEYPTIRNAAPFSKIPLEPGMVITIEPGIYLPGAFGVRIEDTIVITDEGYINLTERPHEAVRITG
jgi:Xaa-Pro aminopeptidase